mgnify:CR=1 FL=1
MKIELHEKHLKEIKTLESEYSRNIMIIDDFHQKQKEITSRIQIILNKIKK